MANIIDKILNTELLLAAGFLLAFIGQATIIPAIIRDPLSGFEGFGALLIVIAAVMALVNKFTKK